MIEELSVERGLSPLIIKGIACLAAINGLVAGAWRQNASA
jgi:hypothetical protein